MTERRTAYDKLKRREAGTVVRRASLRRRSSTPTPFPWVRELSVDRTSTKIALRLKEIKGEGWIVRSGGALAFGLLPSQKAVWNEDRRR